MTLRSRWCWAATLGKLGRQFDRQIIDTSTFLTRLSDILDEFKHAPKESDGFVPLCVPHRVASRVRALTSSTVAQHDLQEDMEMHYHNFGVALAAARPTLPAAEYNRLRRVHRAGNRARHDWRPQAFGEPATRVVADYRSPTSHSARSSSARSFGAEVQYYNLDHGDRSVNDVGSQTPCWQDPKVSIGVQAALATNATPSPRMPVPSGPARVHSVGVQAFVACRRSQGIQVDCRPSLVHEAPPAEFAEGFADHDQHLHECSFLDVPAIQRTQTALAKFESESFRYDHVEKLCTLPFLKNMPRDMSSEDAVINAFLQRPVTHCNYLGTFDDFGKLFQMCQAELAEFVSSSYKLEARTWPKLRRLIITNAVRHRNLDGFSLGVLLGMAQSDGPACSS